MSDPVSAGASDTADRDKIYAKIFWRLMPFLMLCFVISFINRSNIGLAKLAFTQQLHFTEAAYGFGAGIAFLGNVVFELPSQLYLIRVGVRATLMRIMILWGLCCMAMAFMQTALHFDILRFLLGAAEGGFQPGVLFYLTFWIPASRRARITAFFMASIPVSGILGGPTGGWIMHTFPLWHGLLGWQWLFILEGLPAVLLGIATYYVLSDKPVNAPWLSAHEKSVVAQDLAHDRSQSELHGVQEKLIMAFKNPRLYICSLMGFALTVSTSSIYLWLPTIIHNTGMKDVLLIGLLSAVPFLVGFIVQYFVARSSDRHHERRWHSAVPAFVAAIGWGLLPLWASDPTMAMICITLAAAGTMGAMGPFWTLPTMFLSGAASAIGLAAILGIANLGTFISQSVVGWLVDATGSLSSSLYFFGAVMLVGGIASLCVGVPKTKPAMAFD